MPFHVLVDLYCTGPLSSFLLGERQCHLLLQTGGRMLAELVDQNSSARFYRYPCPCRDLQSRVSPSSPCLLHHPKPASSPRNGHHILHRGPIASAVGRMLVNDSDRIPKRCGAVFSSNRSSRRTCPPPSFLSLPIILSSSRSKTFAVRRPNKHRAPPRASVRSVSFTASSAEFPDSMRERRAPSGHNRTQGPEDLLVADDRAMRAGGGRRSEHDGVRRHHCLLDAICVPSRLAIWPERDVRSSTPLRRCQGSSV